MRGPATESGSRPGARTLPRLTTRAAALATPHPRTPARLTTRAAAQSSSRPGIREPPHA
jgi:hypothetical protein